MKLLGPPGMSASDVINKDQGGFEPSIVNIYRAGNPTVEDVSTLHTISVDTFS